MKKILVSMMLVLLWIIPTYRIEGGPYLRKIYLGTINQSTFQLKLGDDYYPIYECLGELFIPLGYIESLYDYDQRKESLKDHGAYLNDSPLYVGNLRTYSLVVGTDYFVPLDVLALAQDLMILGNNYEVRPSLDNYTQYFEINESGITNQSTYPFWVTCTTLYLKDQQVNQSIEPPILIESGQFIPRKEDNSLGIYLTTYVSKVNEWEIPVENAYGQIHEQIYQKHYNTVRLEALEKVFPPFVVKGKLNYGTGPFQKGDEVEVWRAEKKSYFVIKDANGKKYHIGMSGIDIPTETWVPTRKVKSSELEEYINLKGCESDTHYFVWTDLCRQHTHVFKGEKGNWHLEKTLVCSSGKNSSLTPRGTYKMLYQVPYFGEERGFRCKNGVVIYRDYMYHSILFDKTGKYPKESVYQLGQRHSHGCIRLSETDSEWLYRNVPLETTVWIN